MHVPVLIVDTEADLAAEDGALPIADEEEEEEEEAEEQVAFAHNAAASTSEGGRRRYATRAATRYFIASKFYLSVILIFI